MLIYLIILLALICLGTLLFIPMVRFLEHRPILLLYSIVLVFVYSSLFNPVDLPVVSIAGINFNQMDIIGPIILGLCFPFVFFHLRNGFTHSDALLFVLLLWTIILGLNYILGLREFGLQVATNEFRSYFYIICITLYVASLNMHIVWPQIERLFLFGAFCLFVVAAIGFADGDFSRSGRPIGSSHALLILQALLIAIFMYNRRQLSPALMPFVVCLFPLLVILQHRSIWVVMFFSLVSICILEPAMRGRIIRFGLIGLVVVGGLCAVMFGTTIFEALKDSYDEAALVGTGEKTNTFLWRMQGWSSLLTGKQMDSVQDLLIGNPFGSGWERTVLTGDGVDQVRTETPHNFYVQTFLRGGVLGFFAFLALHIMILRKLFCRAQTDPEFRPVFLCLTIVITSQMIYYIPYGSDYVQAIFLGSGVAWLRQSEIAKGTL
jgi:hypothetical protein